MAGAEPNSLEIAYKGINVGHAKGTRVLWIIVPAGADVNASSSGRFTPLMFSARSGALQIARLLLDAAQMLMRRLTRV